MKHLYLFLLCIVSTIFSANQTATVSPIYPCNELPFRIYVELENFSLHNGLRSFVWATFDNKWLLFAGRTNDLKGFDKNTNDFPSSSQNTIVYIVDPIMRTIVWKDLMDPSSGLTQHQIDLLSVTNAEFYQHKQTLYVTGGHGIDSATGAYSTKDTLSAINVPGLMHWVITTDLDETAEQYIRQINDPIFQVTGGYLTRGRKNEFLLVFGQDFEGYHSPPSNGQYSEQIRRFYLKDDGKKLSVHVKKPKPENPDPLFRRRDLNVVPIKKPNFGFPIDGYVAFSGVFTESGGAWTIPVMIDTNGDLSMANPQDPSTFKQGMNNYACPTVGLYSKHYKSMYVVFFGGISYGFFENDTFRTDDKLSFINQFTTIKIDKNGNFSQYLMDAEYPVVISAFANKRNPLLFGAGAHFIPKSDVPAFENGVFKYERIGNKPVILGYIVGGIQSTEPNSSRTDSAASPYIFRVIFHPLND